MKLQQYKILANLLSTKKLLISLNISYEQLIWSHKVVLEKFKKLELVSDHIQLKLNCFRYRVSTLNHDCISFHFVLSNSFCMLVGKAF